MLKLLKPPDNEKEKPNNGRLNYFFGGMRAQFFNDWHKVQFAIKHNSKDDDFEHNVSMARLSAREYRRLLLYDIERVTMCENLCDAVLEDDKPNVMIRGIKKCTAYIYNIYISVTTRFMRFIV